MTVRGCTLVDRVGRKHKRIQYYAMTADEVCACDDYAIDDYGNCNMLINYEWYKAYGIFYIEDGQPIFVE